MRYRLSIILMALSLLGCKDNLDDKSKRNENWVWWTDSKTGKSKWIPFNGNGISVKNGKYSRFYFNGNVFEKGRLINGENVDTIFNYNINGNLQEYRTLSKDSNEYFIKDGPIKIFYASGSTKAIGEVTNHTYGDKWVSYFKNGKYLFVRNLKENTGWVTSYYDNGRVKDSYYVEEGKEYLIKSYYITGQLAKSIEFRNHNYNGLQKEYYINGRKKAMCPRVNGVFNGKQFRWYEDGNLLEISYKKDGELNGGPFSVYYENGKVKMIAYMKNDKFNGEVKQFDETGKLIADDIMDKGVLIKNKLRDSIVTR